MCRFVDFKQRASEYNFLADVALKFVISLARIWIKFILVEFNAIKYAEMRKILT